MRVFKGTQTEKQNLRGIWLKFWSSEREQTFSQGVEIPSKLSLCSLPCQCIWGALVFVSMYVCIYIYIYIYAVELLSGPRLALFKVINWPKFVFFSKTPIAKKHYKNRGLSPFFVEKKNCAQNIWKLLPGPSWRFLRRSQLGPDNNFQLGPDNNFQKCHFFCNFLLRKMC